MAYGLTTDGFIIKRLTVVKEEIETNLRTRLGNSINLLPTGLLGQIVGIISEREALIEEKIQAVYNAFFPDTANSVSLDNVVAITGIKRLEATKGVGEGRAYGTLGTVIPAGSIVSVDGNPDARFVTTTDNTIAAGTNEVQDIDFTAVPDAGAWTLVFDGEETGSLAFNDNAAAVQSALNALPNLSGVTVSGNYSSGFTITFAGDDGQQDQPMVQIGENTLTNTGTQVNVSIVETTPGVLPNVLCELEAETAGNTPAYAGTLTVIDTPLSGWDSFSNAEDITAGNDIETDAALRLRRLQTLATAGAGTVDSIRSRLLEIDEVEQVRVFENDSNVTDGSGRPKKSFEAVVLGGDSQEIADTIWEVKPAGMKAHGSESETVVDTQGFSHTVKFSRPTEIDIYMIINLTTDDDFPVDGEDAVKEALVQYALENFTIGDDIITVRFFTPINEIAGITDAEILIGIAPAPTLDSNIIIADDEVGSFDTSRITVNV